MAPAVAVRIALEALVHSSSVTDARRSGTLRFSVGIIDAWRLSSGATDDGPFPGMSAERNPRVSAPLCPVRWFASSSARDWRA